MNFLLQFKIYQRYTTSVYKVLNDVSYKINTKTLKESTHKLYSSNERRHILFTKKNIFLFSLTCLMRLSGRRLGGRAWPPRERPRPAVAPLPRAVPAVAPLQRGDSLAPPPQPTLWASEALGFPNIHHITGGALFLCLLLNHKKLSVKKRAIFWLPKT